MTDEYVPYVDKRTKWQRTIDDAEAIFNAEMARWEREKLEARGLDPSWPSELVWAEAWERQRNNDWLIEDIWPRGKQLHVHALRKTGKSLVMLYAAARLAMGVDPFTGTNIKPLHVGYFDHEMTMDDVVERLEDMGFVPSQLEGHLHYFLHPMMAPLDTAEGGSLLLAMCIAYKLDAVIIDTMSRVVSGDENSNDTYIRFYRNTGERLKDAGVSLCRLDHEGHETGRSRGASAKADDVDIIWQLKATDDGVQFKRMASRIAWVPEVVDIAKHDEPLRFARGLRSWTVAALDASRRLDALDVPLDASVRQAMAALKQHDGKAGKTGVITEAMRYRRQRFPVRETLRETANPPVRETATETDP